MMNILSYAIFPTEEFRSVVLFVVAVALFVVALRFIMRKIGE